jgi:uncharacterized protein YxjI
MSTVPATEISVFQHLTSYSIRRKVFQFLGASFQVFDEAGKPVAFSKQKAFKLKEDIRVYTDETMSRELLVIKAQNIIDFSSAYGIVDPQGGEAVGVARRKGWKSLVRDSWEILDAEGQVIAKLEEDSVVLALARRFLTPLIPQKFHLKSLDGSEQAALQVHFNPFVFRLSVHLSPSSSIDRRLVFATAVLISAIEGRQRSN